jgi:ankyrin repeat protein
MTNKNQLDNDLIQAAQHANLINVKSLIEQGDDIHAKDDESLIYSSYYGHLEVVTYIVEHGADIHASNDEALRLSAANRHLETVKYLVIDCNMPIKEETLEYLKENNLSEIINIVKSRDLYINLNNKLDNSSNYKTRLKI